MPTPNIIFLGFFAAIVVLAVFLSLVKCYRKCPSDKTTKHRNASTEVRNSCGRSFKTTVTSH